MRTNSTLPKAPAAGQSPQATTPDDPDRTRELFCKNSLRSESPGRLASHQISTVGTFNLVTSDLALYIRNIPLRMQSGEGLLRRVEAKSLLRNILRGSLSGSRICEA